MRYLLLAGALCGLLAASATARSVRAPVKAPTPQRPAPARKHPIARGTFVQDWLVMGWDDAAWRSEIRAMKALGMHIIVFGNTADGKTRVASYPTALPGYTGPKDGADPLDACLRNAEKAGMRVFVGLNFHPDWWSKGANDPEWLYAQMREGNALASDLYGRYKVKYPKAFHGWYWVWEVDNLRFQTPEQRRVLAGALDISVRHLRALKPEMPMMLCPFMNYKLGTPDEYAAMWTDVFASCALGKGDIFAPQDCVGAGGLRLRDVKPWFAALKKAVDTKPGLRFWSDTETFIQEDWTSAPLDRYVAQLKAVQPFVETSITFAWSHYYSPNLVSDGFQRTLLGYVRTGKLETEPPTAPAHVRAERRADGSVRVSWDAAKDNIGVCGYYVFRDGRRVSRQQPARGAKAGAPTVFVDGKAEPGVRYVYHVQAYDYAGNVSPNVGPAAAERVADGPDSAPAAPRLSGGFIQYQPWMMGLSADAWRRELAAMRRAGMDTVVLQWLRTDEGRFIPTEETAVDPTEVILEDADRTGMQVFVGLTADDAWWSKATDGDYLDGAARASIAVAEEAWARYGRHPSFVGWYIPQEPWDGDYDAGQIDRLRGFFRRVTDRCHELSSGKPVACSPFFTGATTPEIVENAYTRLLTGSGLDILMPQDSVGARGWDTDVEARVVPYFQAFRKACVAARIALWSDVESFRLVSGPPINDGPVGFAPTDADRLYRQLVAEAPYVRRFVTFDFFHYMSPHRTDVTKRLYDDYLARLK